jgi:enoyl-CoA hydratase/carnithine racemase
MERTCITVERSGPTVTVTMDLPERRNALGQRHLEELLDAFTEVAGTDATGVVLAGAGPVFSAGHDLAELAGADEATVRRLLETCAALMAAMRSAPQVVIARVHGLATAGGCQLVANADLAVAAESAGFAVPGGKGGWFCTTPMVAVGRAVPRKRAFEMALTGDTIDARTAAAWGLVNTCVPDADLDAAVADLLARATRGSRLSRGMGKAALHRQLDLPLDEAYRLATDVMVRASQLADAQEGMAAFVEKRPPVWHDDR